MGIKNLTEAEEKEFYRLVEKMKLIITWSNGGFILEVEDEN